MKKPTSSKGPQRALYEFVGFLSETGIQQNLHAGLITEEYPFSVRGTDRVISRLAGHIASGLLHRVLFHAIHHNRRQDAKDAQGNQHTGIENRIPGPPPESAKRTAQVLFANGVQNQRQHDGGGVQVELTAEITQHAEDHHNHHVHKILIYV